MAVAFETSLVPTGVVFDAGGEAETVAFDAGSGADRILLVFVAWRDRNNVITGVTYNGVAATAVAATITESSVVSGHLWRLAGPAAGSNNLVVTMGVGDASSAGLISAWVANGSDGTVDGFVNASGNGAGANIVSAPGAITSAVGDMIVSFHATRNGSANMAVTTSTNYTERQDAPDGGGHSIQFGDAVGAASVTTSATWDNTAFQVEWVALGVNVNATGVAETITPDKWMPRFEVRQGVKAVMVPSGMTPPDRND